MTAVVVMGALLQCTMGAAPTPLAVLPANRTVGMFVPIATVMDHIPIANIVPFGTCKTLTAAASGVPTPCIPATVAPWSAGEPTVLIGSLGAKALKPSAKLTCAIGGSISIKNSGQTQINIP